jgi:hypothetical protein
MTACWGPCGPGVCAAGVAMTSSPRGAMGLTESGRFRGGDEMRGFARSASSVSMNFSLHFGHLTSLPLYKSGALNFAPQFRHCVFMQLT